MDVYIIWGKEEGPEADGRLAPLTSELKKPDADGALLLGLMGAVSEHLRQLQPGGRMSLTCAIGVPPTEELPNPTGSFASLVVDNPATTEHPADRHTWEFTVERRATEPVPLFGRS